MTVTSLGYSLQEPEFVHFNQCPCSNDQGYLCTVPACNRPSDTDLRLHCVCGGRLSIRAAEWDDCRCEDISLDRVPLALGRLGRI